MHNLRNAPRKLSDALVTYDATTVVGHFQHMHDVTFLTDVQKSMRCLRVVRLLTYSMEQTARRARA